jgi:hypothetical protein
VGQAGVDIFFVLSSVIIATTAHGLTWQDFASKRLRASCRCICSAALPKRLLGSQQALVGRKRSQRCFFGPPPIAWQFRCCRRHGRCLSKCCFTLQSRRF